MKYYGMELRFMDNKKDDRYYINKMMKDLVFVQEKMMGQSFEDFSKNELLQDSMMFRLIQVSENARKLTDSFRKVQKDIPWNDVFGLRNHIVHAYGGLVLKIVYETLKQDIPDLTKKLSLLFPENE